MQKYAVALLSGGDLGHELAPDVLWTAMDTGQELRGRDNVVQFIIDGHKKISDARVEFKHLIVSDGNAVAEANFRGGHVADFAGIPATSASADQRRGRLVTGRSGRRESVKAWQCSLPRR